MHPTNRLERRMVRQKKRRKRMEHPEAAAWINYYRGVRKSDHKERGKRMDAVVRTIEGGVAIEAKIITTEPIDCEVCGNTMNFVSEEIGHSCENPECILHVGEVSEEV